MSRVLVATLGSVGDLHPFLAIARSLVRQGHSVLFLSSEPHRAAVEAEGVSFTPILSTHDHDRAARHPDLWHPIRGFGILWRHLAMRSVNTTVALLEAEVATSPAPVRVLASPLVLGARLAADWLPIRLVTAHTAPSGLRHLGEPLFMGSWRVPQWWPTAWRRVLWRALDRWKLQPMAAPFIDQWRAAHQLPPLNEPVFDRWLHSPHRVLGLYPGAFNPPAADLPVAMQCVGFPLFQSQVPHPSDAALAAWLQRDNDRPRIAIYAGSSHQHRAKTFQACAERLDAKGWPTLLLMSGEAPDTLGRHGLIRPWADLRSVLPSCQGWLHHGGIGATAEGLLAGLRQWTMPSAYDQFENSWHIARSLSLRSSEVLLTEEQLHSGELPQLDSLAAWPRRPRLSFTDSGDAAVDRVIQTLLEA